MLLRGSYSNLEDYKDYKLQVLIWHTVYGYDHTAQLYMYLFIRFFLFSGELHTIAMEELGHGFDMLDF